MNRSSSSSKDNSKLADNRSGEVEEDAKKALLLHECSPTYLPTLPLPPPPSPLPPPLPPPPLPSRLQSFGCRRAIRFTIAYTRLETAGTAGRVQRSQILEDLLVRTGPCLGQPARRIHGLVDSEKRASESESFRSFRDGTARVQKTVKEIETPRISYIKNPKKQDLRFESFSSEELKVTIHYSLYLLYGESENLQSPREKIN